MFFFGFGRVRETPSFFSVQLSFSSHLGRIFLLRGIWLESTRCSHKIIRNCLRFRDDNCCVFSTSGFSRIVLSTGLIPFRMEKFWFFFFFCSDHKTNFLQLNEKGETFNDIVGRVVLCQVIKWELYASLAFLWLEWKTLIGK